MQLTSIEIQLLAEVKSYLHINWTDENTDNNLIGYIRRGMARLQEVAGVSLDFTVEDLSKSLLLDYCRYANSQALEMFEKNFSSELLELNLSNQFKMAEKLFILSSQGTSSGKTIIKTSPSLEIGNTYMYKLGTNLIAPSYLEICDTVRGYAVWNGIDEIETTTNNEILIVEVDEYNKTLKVGQITVIVG